MAEKKKSAKRKLSIMPDESADKLGESEIDSKELTKRNYPVEEIEADYDRNILLSYKDEKKKKNGKKSQKPKGKKPVLKKALIGMELEFFTIDNEGRMINAADRLISEVKKKYPKIDIGKECGKSMVEITSFPNEQISDTMLHLLENMESILLVAEKEEISVYTLGTYPGSFVPEMRRDKPYVIKENIFGKKRFLIAGRCVGFHCHYTLPWGVFDNKQKILKRLHRSKNQQTMVGSYNLLIAMDPALTTFMQSSPFYQGRFIGKDSRVIVYRGGEDFDYPQGLYANYRPFGALQPYKQTNTDMLDIIFRKYEEWKNLIQKLDVNLRVFSKHGSILDTAWNPVKVNAVGTLEQRGMDSNHPMYLTAAATVIKYILKFVQEENIHVMPSDIGNVEPFKVEGDKLYIPPHTHVRKVLQRNAAYEGLDNDEVYNYCKSMLRLAADVIPKDRAHLLDPFKKCIDERKTVSDEILEFAKKKGADIKETLPKSIAQEIAIEHASRIYKEIILTKKTLEHLKS